MSLRLSKLAWQAIDLVLPPRCPACGEIVERDGRFCEPCWSDLEFIVAPFCLTCGKPFDYQPAGKAVCAACLLDPPRYDSARAALVYGGIARKLVLGLKHSDRPHLANTMAAHMHRAGADILDRDDGLLVPVPLHRWRLWERGYNQALLLARGVARLSGVALSVDALVRVRATVKSGHLGPAERRRNIRDAIALRPGAGSLVAGRQVVLVDDVLTTGATGNACADVLFEAGARSVHLLALARVAHERCGPT